MKFFMGTGSSIHLGCFFNVKGNFILGNNSTINRNCDIDNRGGVKIGNNVSISPYASLITADHDMQSELFLSREGQITLEDFVFIGYRSIVLQNVTMRRASVLGAQSILTKDTKENGIYFGCPATFKKIRENNLYYTTSYVRLFS